MTNKQILIIEDDPAFLGYLQELLEREGFEIFTAVNGQEGLDKLHQLKPQMLITDLLMPEKDGVRLITEVREDFAELPIIAMSGGKSVFSPAFLEAAESLGATYALHKPFDEDHLIEIINNYFERIS